MGVDAWKLVAVGLFALSSVVIIKFKLWKYPAVSVTQPSVLATKWATSNSVGTKSGACTEGRRSTSVPFTVDEMLYILGDDSNGARRNQSRSKVTAAKTPTEHRLSADERYLEYIRTLVARPSPTRPLFANNNSPVCVYQN